MPIRETVDFDAMARRIVELTDLALVREQLVVVWNARGAADTAKVGAELMQMMGGQREWPLHQEPRSGAAHLGSMN